jgi:hypothetical protein
MTPYPPPPPASFPPAGNTSTFKVIDGREEGRNCEKVASGGPRETAVGGGDAGAGGGGERERQRDMQVRDHN